MAAASILARLDSGDPFLVEKPFGEGHVIECAIPVDADWSNLPMRPFYLPLLQRLTIYLASTVFPPRNLDVGKPIVAFLPSADAGKKAMLTTPDGVMLEIPILKKNERGVAEYGRTQRPGLYTLTPPSGSAISYVVNASRKESDLRKLSAKEIADFGKTHGVAVVHSGTEYRELDHAQRYGMELWRPLLWLLLAVLFLEIFLQQKFARARMKVSRAMNEHIRTSLRFLGDWPWWAGARPRPRARRRCLVFLSPRDTPVSAHAALAASDTPRARHRIAGFHALRTRPASSQSHRPAFQAVSFHRWLEEHGPDRFLHGCRAEDPDSSAARHAAGRRGVDGPAEGR